MFIFNDFRSEVRETHVYILIGHDPIVGDENSPLGVFDIHPHGQLFKIVPHIKTHFS